MLPGAGRVTDLSGSCVPPAVGLRDVQQHLGLAGSPVPRHLQSIQQLSTVSKDVTSCGQPQVLSEIL